MPLPLSLSLRVRTAVLALACTVAPLAAQEGAPQHAAADSVLQRLVGEWRMTGVVQGDSVTYTMIARRALARRFVEIVMADVANPPQYEARVFIGADTGAAPRIIVHWLDTFGAAYSVPPGYGTAVGDTIAFTIAYATGQFRDRFTANGDGTWRLLIESRSGNAWTTFADYRMVPLRSRTAPDSMRAEVQPRMRDLPAFSRRMSLAASDLLRDDDALAGRELPMRVAAIVDTAGFVTSASVETSSGNARVDATALTIIRATRFYPGLTDGRPVITRIVQPIRFRFEN